MNACQGHSKHILYEKEIRLCFPGRYVNDDIDQLKNDALHRTAVLFPKVHFPELSLHLYHMTQYIADETHFKEVIERVAKVKKYLWIGTADIKDLYVEERPFLGVLAITQKYKAQWQMSSARFGML